MTKQNKRLTKVQEKLLTLGVGEFMKVDMLVGDDPEPYTFGVVHKAHLSKLMDGAQKKFPGARFKIASPSFVEGSFLRENGRAENAAALAGLLGDVLAITWETIQV